MKEIIQWIEEFFLLLWTASIGLFVYKVFQALSFKDSSVIFNQYGLSDEFLVDVESALKLCIIFSISAVFFHIVDFFLHDKGFRRFISGEQFVFKIITISIFFPVYRLFTLYPIKKLLRFSKRRSIRLKILSFSTVAFLTLFTIIFTLPIWWSSFFILGTIAWEKSKIIQEPIGVSGTGSMYPTFPKGREKEPRLQAQELIGNYGMFPYPDGAVFLNRNFFGHIIGRGDIVSFSNNATSKITLKQYGIPAGFIKRVIALPGETIELRGGFVYINNTVIQESYIASPQSTFGGDFLPDCKKFTIPTGKLFVMGDNRLESLDSRFDLGLIAYEDVDHVLPFKDQVGKLDTNWKNTHYDLTKFDNDIYACSDQFKVKQISKYNPPNYDKDVIQSWHAALFALLEVQPGWQELKNDQYVYERNKEKIDRINTIIVLRISYIQKIIARMDNNEWLTKEELEFIEIDKSLAQEHTKLAAQIRY